MFYEIYLSKCIDEYIGCYSAYGIRAFKNDAIIFDIKDISTDFNLVSKIVSDLNDGDVSLEQAKDIICDMIA